MYFKGNSMATFNEKNVLRDLAAKWMELAHLPVMKERRKLWTALKDLQANRPMVLVETYGIENYVSDNELQCNDAWLKEVEKDLRRTIRHVEEIGDDIVILPEYRIEWIIEEPDYGVPIEIIHTDISGGEIYKNNFKSVEDIKKLKCRKFTVERNKTLLKKSMLEDIVGDILPVKAHGLKCIGAGLTFPIFQLLGMEKMMMWIYDEPEALHLILQYLLDDRKSRFEWMEQENLLDNNNDSAFVGSGSPGFVSSLPASDYSGKVRRKDLWLFCESQETLNVSPQKFKEIFLPYLAQACKDFGLIYYGCCEPVHDRWQYITEAIPNIRAVSISPWCDLFKMGEMLGKNIVFSRKPNPVYISGKEAEWDLLRKDIVDTYNAAQGCNLEIIYRDLYQINNDRDRLSRWVRMARSIIN
jgi:hypothetical protein